MIAIFNTLVEAQAYSEKIHEYLTINRPGYNAIKWGDPVQSGDNLTWFVKCPSDMIIETTELSKAVGKTIPLPETGQVTAGLYYQFKGDVVKCIQSHTRTEWEPKDIPALFTFFRNNTDQLQWIENERIEVGWERIYNTVRYKCIQAHTTVVGQTPNLVPALWVVVTTSTAWTVGVAYKVNDVVTYLGKSYKCLQAHTAIQSWNPVAVLNILWKLN